MLERVQLALSYLFETPARMISATSCTTQAASTSQSLTTLVYSDIVNCLLVETQSSSNTAENTL